MLLILAKIRKNGNFKSLNMFKNSNAKKLNMNKYILIFSILFCGCNSAKVELQKIEIMAYNYELDSKMQKFIPISVFYSTINSLGNAKNLIKTDSVNIVGYNSIVDKNLVQEIADEVFKRNSTYFEMQETDEIFIYDGPVIRIKISYTNGKVVSFIFYDINYNENSKYQLYKSLYEQSIDAKKTNTYNSKELIELKRIQNEFAKYANHKDTLLLPMPPIMPPTPPIYEVKFVKQPK